MLSIYKGENWRKGLSAEQAVHGLIIHSEQMDVLGHSQHREKLQSDNPSCVQYLGNPVFRQRGGQVRSLCRNNKLRVV